ncbi:RraA family protein [Marinibaculum pumilum]|uniref:Putative 4-hydroxy-4-methyl-2-oxoglutarate aldolase n=1 Tax=Marinibaculum pumilum TaxID=1766165 RepID=A0ABV7L3S4_9PROT
MDDTLRREMLAYDTCLVSDALEKLGLPHGIQEIQRLTTRRRIFGRCVTVQIDRFSGDVPKRHLGANAVEAAAPGDIIVMSHRSRDDCACWGGLLSTSASLARVGGVIVDGRVRDIDESEDLALPVFARGATPVTARSRVMETATNEPIEVGHATVRPGDYVLADGSGIAFIPADRFDELLAVARELHAFEEGVRDALFAGRSIGEVMNQNYETLLKTKASG